MKQVIIIFSIITHSQLWANNVSSVSNYNFSSPSDGPTCSTELFKIANDAVEFGLKCFKDKKLTARMDEFSNLFRPNASADIKHDSIQLDCRDSKKMDYRAYANQDESPYRVEFSTRMSNEVSQGLNREKNLVTIFHEFIHLLSDRYHHLYEPNFADITIACEICCSEGLNIELGYLDRSKITSEDRTQLCKLCENPIISDETAELNYRKRLFELATQKNKSMMLENLLALLKNRSAEVQRSSLDADIREQICRLVEVENRSKMLKLLDEKLSTEIQNQCSLEKSSI